MTEADGAEYGALLYDSERFVVVQQSYKIWVEFIGGIAAPVDAYLFEIADKRDDAMVVLTGPQAVAFQAKIDHWADNTPEQTEVELTLERFTQLGRLPMTVH